MSCTELWAHADTPTLWTVGSLLVGTLGAAGATLGYRILGRQVDSWPIVQARVESAEVFARGKDGCVCKITYSYVVEGQTYTSSRYQVGGGQLRTAARRSAGEEAHAYRVGRKIGALYCPADPSFAVLRPGAPSFHLYGLGVLVLLNVFFFAVFC